MIVEIIGGFAPKPDCLKELGRGHYRDLQKTFRLVAITHPGLGRFAAMKKAPTREVSHERAVIARTTLPDPSTRS